MYRWKGHLFNLDGQTDDKRGGGDTFYHEPIYCFIAIFADEQGVCHLQCQSCNITRKISFQKFLKKINFLKTIKGINIGVTLLNKSDPTKP